jgi:hypothetical protein
MAFSFVRCASVINDTIVQSENADLF